MAKKNEVNKAKAVRDYVNAHPSATNKEILAALAKKGIVLTANRVSGIKAKSKARWRSVRKVVNEVAVSRGVGLAEIKVALSLLALTGGVEKANRALAAAAAEKVIGGGGVRSPEVKVASSLLKLTDGIEGAKLALAAAEEIRARL